MLKVESIVRCGRDEREGSKRRRRAWEMKRIVRNSCVMVEARGKDVQVVEGGC